MSGTGLAGGVELWLAPHHWTAIVRAISAIGRSRRDDVVIGRLGIAKFRSGRLRLLVRGVETVSRARARHLVSQGAPWVVVEARTRRGDDEPSLTSVVPRGTLGPLALVELGVGAASGVCRAIAWSEDRWLQVTRLATACGTVVDLSPTERAPLHANDHERWSRTIGALGQPLFARLHRCHVVVAGLGRSGSLVAHLIALQGVAGRLDLIDADLLELANLDATFGVDPSGIGASKASLVATALRRVRADLPVRCRAVGVEDRPGVRAVRDADLVITTVDRDLPPLATALIANAYLVPHLDIGTGILARGSERRAGADIRLLLPGDGCVRCVGGLADEEQTRRDLTLPDTARTAPPRWFEERAGSLASINATAAGIGVQLWLDFVAGRVLRLEWRPDGELTVVSLSSAPEPGCPVCSAPGLGDYRFGAAFG